MLLLPLLGATLFAPIHARAQDGEGDAIEEARAALREGDPELAIDILDEARASSTDPALRYELYLAHTQTRELELAASHLQAYLDTETRLDPEERRTLESHLADLRAAVAPIPTSGDPWSDPIVAPIGWALFAAGIAGLITFATGAVATLVIENNLSEDCRREARLCAPGERDPIDTAWIVAGVGLGAGVLLGAIGAALLVLADEHQSGPSRSLPPDLDPTMQRIFSLRPWVDPRDGGSGGATFGVSF